MITDLGLEHVVGLPPHRVEQRNLVGIGITTRDRWEDLSVTLAELATQRYDVWETVVIDDGSAQPAPVRLRERFPKVQFVRTERSRGLVVQRNRLAAMLSTTYYLSLDDDSFPVDSDIVEAATWLEHHPNVAGLALHVAQAGEAIPARDQREMPFPVRYFIGCGHLVRRELFLRLGGYLERLHYFAEENNFCLKALRRGYSTYAFPGVAIRHNRTAVARNSAKAARFYIRNEAVIGLLHFPFPYSVLRAVNCLQILRLPKWNSHFGSLVTGWLEAFWCATLWWRCREPLSLKQFRAWKSLPLPKQ